MNKAEMITMLERHIADHEAHIDNLLIERKAIESDKLRALLEEQIGNYSRMAQANREMIKEMKL